MVPPRSRVLITRKDVDLGMPKSLSRFATLDFPSLRKFSYILAITLLRSNLERDSMMGRNECTALKLKTKAEAGRLNIDLEKQAPTISR